MVRLPEEKSEGKTMIRSAVIIEAIIFTLLFAVMVVLPAVKHTEV